MTAINLLIVAAIGIIVSVPAYAEPPPAASSNTMLDVVNIINKLVQTLAVLVAAGWAYFRFIRFRALKKRVEYQFEWKTSRIDDQRLLGILTVKLLNKSNTQIELRKDRDFRCTPYSRTFFKKPLNYRGSHDLAKICSRRIKWC